MAAKKNIIIIAGIILLCIVAYLWRSQLFSFGSAEIQYGTYPEAGELAGKNLSFKDLSNFFTALAEKKGGRYAFEVLKRAPAPPNTDLHLLGHVVGDELYKQEGIKGIEICTNDFRNACSHSIVVGIFSEKGDSALGEIADTCRRAPGGSGAYTMCFHGLGHGILSAVGYDMEKTVALCQKTGTEQYNNREYIECVGGAVMEIVGGGGHDRELWEKQRALYLRAEKPLDLCRAAFMPRDVQSWCFVYITPFFWEAVGGDIGNPTDEVFTKAFRWCDKIPLTEMDSRGMCFSGFGKEFVGLALSRDIRADAVQYITDEQLQWVYERCLLAKNKEGAAACVTHAMQSLFWGGENNRSVALRYCGVIPASDDYNRGSCYADLTNAVFFYIKDKSYHQAFCEELPEKFRNECENRI
ncbi:MAG: hypothetical protein HYT37_02715 [Candidatus Sungbacteria bacterium]|nr:hypothetical protein [Candidatus Sungbacteria bacterium]